MATQIENEIAASRLVSINRYMEVKAALMELAMRYTNGYEECTLCSRIALEPGVGNLPHDPTCPLRDEL